tara:strand:- start:255 stop:581 length:327 start_codon:yes stop_codon:yes gene_type:complete
MEQSIHNGNTFEQLDCDLFHNSMSPNSDQFEFAIPNFTQDRYQREAYSAWYDFYESKSDQNKVRNYVNGTLTCFCDDEYDKFGFKIFSKSYRADGQEEGFFDIDVEEG